MASAQPRTWSSWLGVDAESKASAAAKKELETEAKHSKAVEELRNLFDCEEGRICGRQLAEGGEFGRGGDASELVSDAYLRRWLVARDWNVEVTHKLLLRHADWRARTSPKGYIEEGSNFLGMGSTEHSAAALLRVLPLLLPVLSSPPLLLLLLLMASRALGSTAARCRELVKGPLADKKAFLQ
ncbi:hypothetical protein MNEG_15871, partial [Monoraphidium neglectum]